MAILKGISADSSAFTIRYKGVFDFDGLSSYIIKWLSDRGYKITEKKHKHKMSGPKGFEIEWGILGDVFIDDYYKHNINVGMHLWDAHQVDAVKDGKKVKFWSARIEIVSGFKVEMDYQGRWDSPPWKQKLRDNFFHEYIIKKEIIFKHVDPLYYKVLELHTNMKKFVGMTTTNEF